jgi:fatty-acyl-CoA synthase
MNSYTSGTSSIPLLGMTIGEKFDEIAHQFAENEALVVVHQHIRWTYQELQREVEKCAKSLLACGLKKGDRVGIWAPNCYEWTVLQFATAKTGIILVNINPSYRKHELKYAMNQSGCKMLVLADHFKYSHYTQMIQELVPELADSRFGELQSEVLPDLKMAVVSQNKDPGFVSWNHFMTKSEGVTKRTWLNDKEIWPLTTPSISNIPAELQVFPKEQH